MPGPDVGWARGAEGLLGWGTAQELVARTPEEVDGALDALLASSDGPWLGGWAFDLSRLPGGEWTGFPLLRFVVPQVVLSWTLGGASIKWVLGAEHLAAEILERARPGRAAARAATPIWTEPARAGWAALHASALTAIGEGTLQKVVLSRAVEGHSQRSPWEVFTALARDNPGARAYLVREGARWFVGATPETLCSVDGLALETEALAGTAALTRSAELLQSGKDLREHALVVDAVRSALEGRVASLSVAPGPELIRLPSLAHLRTRVTAQLAGRAQLRPILRALHPTPAVNGTPGEAAARFLREHEQLERGWFTGVVGCVDGARAEFRVALRGALLGPGERVRAFAGAGVVAGSTADGEWDETARKMRTVQAALEAHV